MTLVAYKCVDCKKTQYAFVGEEYRLQDDGCCYEAQPPDPTTIHATNTYMSEPQLDSWASVYELDRMLNIEMSDEKELAAFNEFRKNT